jgi:tetratricopeptide (TPR) repeat protein
LIEWGCELLRADATPEPIERWWQLGALSVAHRSEDYEFLAGNPTDPLRSRAEAVGNVQKEIEHLNHVMPRFPDEARFPLGGAIALEWKFPAESVPVFESLKEHIDVGAEATLRLGAIALRRGNDLEAAIETFARVETLTRDPYLIFLARYFTGQAQERRRRASDAEVAYRRAIAAVPHAQSATTALAALLFRSERRAEAQRLAAEMLAAQPPPPDPWREYAHADDRFWPQIIGRLRREIAR